MISGRTSQVASKATGPSSSPPVISTSARRSGRRRARGPPWRGTAGSSRAAPARGPGRGRCGPRAPGAAPCRRGSRAAGPRGRSCGTPVDVLVELGLVDVDRQLDLVALEGLQRTLHRSSEGIGSRRARPRRPVGGGQRPPLAWTPCRSRSSLRQRLGASVAELDRTRLQDRCRGLDVTPLDELPPPRAGPRRRRGHAGRCRPAQRRAEPRGDDQRRHRHGHRRVRRPPAHPRHRARPGDRPRGRRRRPSATAP